MTRERAQRFECLEVFFFGWNLGSLCTAKRLRLKAQGCFNPGKEQFAENFNPERVATGHRKGFRLGRTLEERRNRLAVEIAYLRFPRVEATLGFGP